MTRDMELTRKLLLWVDGEPRLDGTPGRFLVFDNGTEVGAPDHSVAEVAYHLRLLVEAGFLLGKFHPVTGMPVISRMTWNGHEFLDNVKDSTVWENTKSRIAGLPGVALAVIAEIAKAEIKKKLGLP
ncbi:MAG: DUF2513 domain-containing protein [Candidatus Sulfotelmatobacter sp.]|jgi:hypothetical protein